MRSSWKLARSLLLAGLVAVGQAQQAPDGAIAGSLYDSRSGRAVAGAVIELVELPAKRAISAQDGKFSLEAPPGVYTLNISAPQYLPVQIRDVLVESGKLVEISKVLALASDVTTVNVVEQAPALAASAEALVAERRLIANISDGTSAEEIRKSVASDAAAALTKVTGVSLVGSGYVYVRGLGERYSATMLNNALIPTTEPERRVVPLDLFPAQLIGKIQVLKTYTPDLPGEFSGGLVQMRTVEFPAQRTFHVSTSYGFNTRTSFQQFLTHRGGRYDFFGFDDGRRSLPSVIPANDRLFPGRFNEQQFEAFGEAFANDWEPQTINSMRPQQTYSVVGGDTFGRLGLVGALTLSNKPQRFLELQRYLVNAGNGLTKIHTEYPEYTSDVESARLGAVMNAALRLTPSHKLLFQNTLTRDTDKETRIFSGYNGGVDAFLHSTRLRYVERSLFSTGVEGEHTIVPLGHSLLHWQWTSSSSQRQEPDLREIFRTPRTDGVLAFSAMPQSALRLFSGLRDRIYEPLAELGTPFYRGSLSGMLRLGFRGTFRDRDFQARRFRYTPVRTATLDFTQPSNILLGPENIRPDGFVIREVTRGTDTYNAGMEIYAGFTMADLMLGPRWRLVGGFRVEDGSIRVTTIDPLVPGSLPAVAQLNNRDLLPAVNLIYSLSQRQNLRLAYGRTLSRPDFRELSPFDFTNVLGGFNVVGNPNLVRARIDNFDTRWEWFLGGEQLLAASVFYKRFEDPIEITIQPTTSDLRQTFLNADGARNAGFEVEVRRRVPAVHPSLAGFTVTSNFTFVDSRVRIPDSQRNILTSLDRPLMGQSRCVANLIIDWARPKWRSSARFYLNYTSRRLSDVGSMGLPDIYQEGNLSMDAVYQFDVKEGGKWSMRLAVENLGDTHFRWSQGGVLQRSYRLGRTFTIGTTYSIF